MICFAGALVIQIATLTGIDIADKFPAVLGMNISIFYNFIVRLCLTNEITFWVPAPVLTPRGKISRKKSLKHETIRFKKKGKYKHFFKKQFINASPSSVQLAPTKQELVKAALNSGYGSHHYDRLNISQAEWNTFGNFLNQRFHMLLALLTSASLPLTCGTVHKLLETTELMPMSNLLGSIFCRIASDSWESTFNHQGKILHFWHWKIFRNPAVQLTGQHRLGMVKVLNPDFVFKTSRGWYTVEAKGSFDRNPQVWTELRWGLQQAAKFEQISIYEIRSCQTIKFPVSGYACTMAYFDQNQHLQVTHLDPPSPLPGADVSTATIVVQEFIYLVQLEQAFDQFTLLSRPSDGLPRAANESTLIDWRLIFGQADADDAIFIGKPYLMNDLKAQVSLALKALRILMPIVGDKAAFGSRDRAAEKNLVEADIQSLRQTWMTEASRARSPIDRSFWRGLASITDLPTERLPPDIFWKDLLKRSTITPLLENPSGEGNISILDLSDRVKKIFDELTLYASILSDVTQRNDTPRSELKLSATDNGLLLAPRKWFMIEPAKTLPKFKI